MIKLAYIEVAVFHFKNDLLNFCFEIQDLIHKYTAENYTCLAAPIGLT